MHLRVRYQCPAELMADHAAQLARGGLLVRVDVGEIERLTKVALTVVLDDEAVLFDAEVAQAFAGVGVAVTFAPSPQLDALIERARGAPSRGVAAVHELVDDEAEAEAVAKGRPTRWVNPMSEKVNAALKGTREERTAILRENLPQLHLFVLKNPALQLDEVATIARMRTVTPEVLKTIAERREWAGRPEVAAGLVRNPKTPLGIAIRLLDAVSPTELRALAKDGNVRAPIMSAARKKVAGGG
jgi:hypothetical protein